MSLPPDPPIDYALAATNIRPDALVRIKWNDGQVSRLTSAFAGLKLPADAVEDQNKAYYSGLPAIRQIPALRQLVNGISDSVEFQISGLPSHIAEIADNEANLGEGAEIYVGKVYWDRDWRMIGTARWVWLGAGGTVRIKENGGSVGDGKFTPASVTVSIEGGTQQIRRAGSDMSLWSDAQHQRDHPGDLFFERASLIAAGVLKAFPKL